jgi:uncharacterized RDD family membrane protein YckC
VAGSATLPPLASLDARFSAYLIDGLIIFVPSNPVILWSVVQRDLIWCPPLILWILVWHVYWMAFWSRLGRGQTPGTRIRWIRVIGQDGRDLGLGHALLRATVLFFGSGFGVVPLSVLLDRDGIGLHDRLAGSRVVRVASPSGHA